jgi:ATP-dependent protease ClpP protease subunit
MNKPFNIVALAGSDTRTLLFTIENRIHGNKAFMLMNKGIGPDASKPNSHDYIDGAAFADEVYWHKASGRDVEVKINTSGGRVDHGWSMIDAIITNGADTFCTGIAYSMGGICLMAGKHRKAYTYASCMIHSPRPAKGSAASPMLEHIRSQFKTLLENRTKFTADEINKMMDSGDDFFFNAQEMLAKGIIDEIIQPVHTPKAIPVNATATDLQLFYNSFENQNPKSANMDIIASLKARLFPGKTDATDADVLITSVTLQSENAALKVQLENVTKERDQYKAAAEKTATASAASELVASAEKAGKLKFAADADRTAYVAAVEANFDVMKLHIDAIPAPAAPATTPATPGKKTSVAAAVIASAEVAKDETYEYLAQNDPQKLAKILEEQPEVYAKLEADFIKRTKK